MTSNWEKFKNKTEEQPTGEDKPQGRKMGGSYRCQHCPRSCTEAHYFPVDSILRYVCEEGHVNFIENFKLAF